MVYSYNLGTFKLLLTIAHPHAKNRILATWTLHGFPSAKTPKGNPVPPSCQPFHKHIPIIASMHSVVGIGNPSKYFALPAESLGSEAAVTLKRANLERPERRKKERMNVSTVVRRPRVNASTDGATPNDTYT